jgi:FkbM family methyltransferase
LSFYAVCEQGIFEKHSVSFLTAQTRPGTVVFDVGANIGLMAVPVLRSCETCSVISFEPSPNVLPFLRKTIDRSSFGSRWSLIEKAVADFDGDASFSVSDPKASLFDGIRDTHRFGARTQAQVLVTALDSVWQSKGRPNVSVIKCDVEGGELAVLKGARQCLQQVKPAVLIEWNASNLRAHDCSPESILPFCNDINYRIFSVPGFIEIKDATELQLQMMSTENFALLPR